MPDAQVSRRGLWRAAFRKPEFRSHREKWGYYSYMIGVGVPIVVLVALLAPTNSALYSLGAALCVMVAQSGGWLVWLAWGRERFSLASPETESADS